jgi:hypothetical protein
MAIARSPILQLPSIGRATSAVLAAVDTAHPHPPDLAAAHSVLMLNCFVSLP